MRTFRLPDRSGGVLSRAVGDEFVVVDPATGTAHALSGAAALVWAATGSGDVPELPAGELERTLAELTDLGLLVPARGLSRRDLFARGGLVAAGVGVASIALPMADAAASTTVSGTLTPGQTTYTIPVNARAITITIAGGGGGTASDHSGTPGGGGIVTFSPGIKLTSPAVLTFAIGRQGTNAALNSASAPGGTGGNQGGDGGGNPAGSNGDLGGGGGGSTSVTFTGGLAGSIIAGGGGGAGNGYGGTITGDLSSSGGDGGSDTAGSGGAGTGGGLLGVLGGAGGAAASIGGPGADGRDGTVTSSGGINGGGGGGAGAKAGGAGSNGGTTTGGGGGGAGSSAISGFSGTQPAYGPASTPAKDGYISYTYIVP